jgi:hypothetical protein
MGNGARKDEPSNIPASIRHFFEVADIDRMFTFMEGRYHLHPDWRKQFKEDLKKQRKDLPDVEYFFIWSNEHINYALKALVRRNANIINDIAAYLLRDRIEGKRKEQDLQRDFYRKGEWKKDKTV